MQKVKAPLELLFYTNFSPVQRYRTIKKHQKPIFATVFLFLCKFCQEWFFPINSGCHAQPQRDPCYVEKNYKIFFDAFPSKSYVFCFHLIASQVNILLKQFLLNFKIDWLLLSNRHSWSTLEAIILLKGLKFNIAQNMPLKTW